jgi:hypothetical protein
MRNGFSQAQAHCHSDTISAWMRSHMLRVQCRTKPLAPKSRHLLPTCAARSAGQRGYRLLAAKLQGAWSLKNKVSIISSATLKGLALTWDRSGNRDESGARKSTKLQWLVRNAMRGQMQSMQIFKCVKRNNHRKKVQYPLRSTRKGRSRGGKMVKDLRPWICTMAG